MPEQIIETRSAELRATPDSRTILGRAIVFDSPAEIYDFEECIAPGAVTDELLATSDVLMLLEHDQSRGVLGRSRRGNGTLTLERRDDGVYVSCTLPDTPLGNEVLEGVRRGDYSQMSFAFTVRRQSWTVREGAPDLRTIEEIENIYDVSVVARPAYEETEIHVDYRGRSQARAAASATSVNANTNSETIMPEQTNTNQTEAAVATEQRNAFVPRQSQPVSGHFSLVSAIRAMTRGQNLGDAEAEVCRRGREIMQHSNLECAGNSLVLPSEYRSTFVAGTASEGQLTAGDAVAEDLQPIFGPLYDNLVLRQAGATILTGLVGNVSLPSYSGSQVTWEGETAEAKDGGGTLNKITLTPHRLTAYVEISNQMLLQDSVGLEAMLRADITRAIQQKLEATILGDKQGDNSPSGMFHGQQSKSEALTFADVVGMEKTVEQANAGGNLHFITNPAIKAQLRTTSVDAGSGRFVMENGEIDGIPTLVTNACAGLVLGDFSHYIIAQWGAVELIVDTLTKADRATTRLIVNAYFDAQARRPEVFAYHTTTTANA